MRAKRAGPAPSPRPRPIRAPRHASARTTPARAQASPAMLDPRTSRSSLRTEHGTCRARDHRPQRPRLRVRRTGARGGARSDTAASVAGAGRTARAGRPDVRSTRRRSSSRDRLRRDRARSLRVRRRLRARGRRDRLLRIVRARDPSRGSRRARRRDARDRLCALERGFVSAAHPAVRAFEPRLRRRDVRDAGRRHGRP